jgi:glutamate carboxypeptidase
MLNFLRELVAIPSETKERIGVLQAQTLVFEKLKKCEAALSWLDPEKPGFAPGLLASWGADDASSKGGVCIVSHADTVYAQEDLVEFRVDEKSGKIFGGGVADNKGGLVVACAAIEKLSASGAFKNAKRPLHFFSSSCEELGSPAFQKFIKTFSGKLEYVLGMEPALPNGDLIKKRRGNRYYNLKIRGNSVHTGRDVADAANPVGALAQIYLQLENLKAKHPRISVSVNGVSSHPFKYNMSSDSLEVTVDVRFESVNEVQAFHEGLVGILNNIKFASPNGTRKGSIDLELVDDCPAFDCSPTLNGEFSKLTEIYSRVEKMPVALSNGLGSSDCCYFYRPGLKIVDGLGLRGGKIHSSEEFAEIKSLETRSTALAEFLTWLLHN